MSCKSKIAPYVVATALMFLAGCGGGGGGTSAPGPGGGPSVAPAAGLIVQTAASADYRSVGLAATNPLGLSFTGLYRAWFTRIEYQPPTGWLCGRMAGDGHKVVVSREDGSGAHAEVALSFSSPGGGGTFYTVEYPTWSPDGRYIAVSAAGQRIVMFSLDGRKLEPIDIFALLGTVDGLSWSSDGKLYAVIPDDTGQVDIYCYSPLTGPPEPVRVTNTADLEEHVDVSPDAKWLAFAGRPTTGDDWDIFIMPVGGNPATDATNVAGDSSADETWPRWSPDGRFIAYLKAPSDGAADVYVVDTVTGWRVRLTDSTDDEDSCDWSSDGQYVLFTRNGDLYRIPYNGAPGDETLVRANWGTHVASWAPGVSRHRVLVGPAGSDWGGEDPPFGAKRPGAVVVTSPTGLKSAVSFAVSSSDTLLLADRTPVGSSGVVICEARAGNLWKVLEDNGPGRPKTVWDLERDGTAPGATLVAFNGQTGKVTSVTAIWDQVGSAAASGPRVALEDGNIVLRAPAMVVYDAGGGLASGPQPLSRVVLDGRTGEFVR